MTAPLLVLTNQLHAGGAERYVVTLADWLVRHDAPPVVAASPGVLIDALPDGTRYVPVPLRDVRGGLPLAAWRVGRLVRTWSPRAIVANSLVTAAVGKLASLGRVPVVAVAHGWPADRYARVAPLLRVADHVVAVSEDVSRRLVDAGLPASRVTVIGNGVDTRRFGPLDHADRTRARLALGADDGHVVAVSVGRFVPQKAQHRLVSLAARLRTSHPQLRWALVGWGPEEPALRDAIARHGVGDVFRLLLDRQDVPDLLRAADLYVSTSTWEGMPIATLEAMAAGLPVVTTDTEGAAALVDDENGARVPVGDEAALAAAVVSLADDEPRRLRLGAESRTRVLERHSADGMCRALVDLIARLRR